ncbi:zinc finger protein 569 [Drosophila sulfurigaster albostrigata]|uniref:zinc finger protein 569 n=1 Tax=Drosophila sulfurigaster albostrigata TaxID=89887 RepID=UPI002D21E281|nr:zinc finger protein 569 [Drosophila sulfurigaster albostrigata]
MELPSMVQRAGSQLLVRSLVSGVTVFKTGMDTSELAESIPATTTHPPLDAQQLERQLQLLNTRSFALPVVNTATTTIQSEEELPQCKIRRNYSCNSCAFFTQNPRSHLSHLRDVHGEKIVINECKLCLYASRHFQKLVRHMKMVHGCSDVDSSGAAGRRHCNREARKRRLEESIEMPASIAPVAPSLTQLKNELQTLEQQLLNNVEAFSRQQQLQQLQQLVARSGNIFSMAFEFQMCLLPPTMPSEDVERDAEMSSSDSDELSLAPVEETKALDLSASSSSNANEYQCQKCSYSTPIRARFKKHVKYHSMPLIKCGSCDFHSPYKWNLERHTRNHGTNGYLMCSVCDFSTNIKQSMTIHEMNHHVTLGRFGQDQQQQQQSPQKQLKIESSSSPEKWYDSPELPPISCSHCHQIVPNAMELVQHLQQCEPALRSNSNLGGDSDSKEEVNEEEYRNETSYYGVETAPGYGEVTEPLQPEDSDALKKVFKCPHCTFWAATASRFHVHIVGHLNRKPFECSLCSYRSNWRWDITKHIRLKTMRDKSHVQAQVLMNDETGRRNYAKYNQYLTLMKVSAEQVADAKTMRCGEMHSSSSDQHMLALPQPDDEDEAQADVDAALDLRVISKQHQEQQMPEQNQKPHKSKKKHRKREAQAEQQD